MSYIFVPSGGNSDLYGDIDDKYRGVSKQEHTDYGFNMPHDSLVDFEGYREDNYFQCPEIHVSEEAAENLIMEMFQEHGDYWAKMLIRVISQELFSAGYSYVQIAEKLCNIINYFIKHPDYDLLSKEDFDLFATQLLFIYSIADSNFYHNYSAYSKKGPFKEIGVIENLAYFFLECDPIPKWLNYLSEIEDNPKHIDYLKHIIKFARLYSWVLKQNMEEPSYADMMKAILALFHKTIKTSGNSDFESTCNYIFLNLNSIDPRDEEVRGLLEMSKELLGEDKLNLKMNAVAILTNILSRIKPINKDRKKFFNEWLWSNHIYEKLFFEECHDSLLSNAEKLFYFMLEEKFEDFDKLVAVAIGPGNIKMKKLLLNALSKTEFPPENTSMIASTLIDDFSKGKEDEFSKEILFLALEKSASDPILKKKYVNAAINKCLILKEDPQKMQSLIKDYEKVISIRNLYNEEDIVKFISMIDHERNVAIKTLLIAGIKAILKGHQQLTGENYRDVLVRLVNDFSSFCSEDTVEDYALEQRLSTLSVIITKFRSCYSDFVPLVEAILGSARMSIKEKGASWLTDVLKGNKLCDVNYDHLTTTFFNNSNEITQLGISNSACFEFFESCFMFSNGMDESSGFKIKTLPINHLDDLVNVVLSSKSDSSFKKSSGLLVRALDGVSLESLDEMNAFRRGFVIDLLLNKASENRANAMKLLGVLLSDTTEPQSCTDGVMKELTSRFPNLRPSSSIFIVALIECQYSVEEAAAFIEEITSDETFSEDDYPEEEGSAGIPGEPYSKIMSTDLEISRKVYDILFAQEVIGKSKSIKDFYTYSGIEAFTDVAASVRSFVFPTFKESLENGRLFGVNEFVIQDFLATEVVVKAKLAQPKEVYEKMVACANSAVKILGEKSPSNTEALLVSAISSIVESSCEPIAGIGKLFSNIFITFLLKWTSKNEISSESIQGISASLIKMFSKIPRDEADTIDFGTKIYMVTLKASPNMLDKLLPLIKTICELSTTTYIGLVSKFAKYILLNNSADVRMTKENILRNNVFPVFFSVYTGAKAPQNSGIFTEEFLTNSLDPTKNHESIISYFDNVKLARNYARFLSLVRAGAFLSKELIERLTDLLGTDKKSLVHIARLLDDAVEKSGPGSYVVNKCFETWNKLYDEADSLGMQKGKEKVRREKHGGLENTSSNCYANSAIQLLYMSEFRTNLLELPIMDKDPKDFKNSEEAKNFDSCKNTVIHAQKLFIEMLVSNKECSDPLGMMQFWKSLGEQEDIYAFIVEFIGKISTYEKSIKSLSDSGSASIGCDMYVQKETEMVCSAGHSSKKESHMSVLSLCIDNADTLDDAIEASLKTERIHGYSCPACGENSSVDVDLSHKITQLGNTLIIQLNRVFFDAASGQPKKNHKNVSFGLEMDMSKYVEGADGPDMFALSGIVMHLGGANSGHYYVYARDMNTAHGEKDKWYKFNDKSVLPWDIKDLESDCDSCITPGDPDVSKSPYIFLYTRKGKPMNVPRKKYIENTLAKGDSDQLCKCSIVREILAKNEKRDKLDVLFDPDFNRVAVKACTKYFEQCDRGYMAEGIMEHTINLFSETSRSQIVPWMTDLYPKLTKFHEFNDSFINLCGMLLLNLATSSNLAPFLDVTAKSIAAYFKVRGMGDKGDVLDVFFTTLFERYFAESSTSPPPETIRFVLEILKINNRMLDSMLVSSLCLLMLFETLLKEISANRPNHDLLQAVSELLQRFQIGGSLGRNEYSPLAYYQSIYELSPRTTIPLCDENMYIVLIDCSPCNPEAVARILRHVIGESSITVGRNLFGSIKGFLMNFVKSTNSNQVRSFRVIFRELTGIKDIHILSGVVSAYVNTFMITCSKVFDLSNSLPESTRNEFIGIYEDMLTLAKTTTFSSSAPQQAVALMNNALANAAACVEENPKGPLNDRLSAILNGAFEMLSGSSRC